MLPLLLSPIYSLLYYCPTSYYFNSQHCASCLFACTCTSENTCQACAHAYTLSSDRQTCLACPGASAGFAACTSCCSHSEVSSLTCTDCDDSGYSGSVFLVGGRCHIKIGCFQVDQAGSCVECNAKYFLQDASCTACHSSCQTCISTDSCLTCADGYFRDSSVAGALCSSCFTGCATCTNSSQGSCGSCLTGYYLLFSMCQTCPTGCSECVDGTFCQSCLTSRILLAGTCNFCTDTTVQGSIGCERCQNRFNFIYCTECADTYLLVEGKCHACSSLISNSVRCSSNITATQCASDSVTTLTLRYYLISGRCIQNSNSCKDMLDGLGRCLTCYDGYILVNAVCTACSLAGCSSHDPANCACSACNSQYYLSGTQCLACPTSCDTCSAVTCSACIPTFFLNSGTCVSCSVTGCSSCPSNSCDSCLAGYRMYNSLCFSCPVGCATCSAKLTCTSCSSYYRLEQGGCMALEVECVQYLSNMSCGVCRNGYYVQEGGCRECVWGEVGRCELGCLVYIPENISRFKVQPMLVVFGCILLVLIVE